MVPRSKQALAVLTLLAALACNRAPPEAAAPRPTPEELARLSLEARVDAAAQSGLPDGGAPGPQALRYLAVLGHRDGTVPARPRCAGTATDLAPVTEVLGVWRVTPGSDVPQPVDPTPWRVMGGTRGTESTLSLGTHWVWLTCLSPTDAAVANARIVKEGSAGFAFDLRREGDAWHASPARRTWTR